MNKIVESYSEEFDVKMALIQELIPIMSPENWTTKTKKLDV
jgi:hypothetical protein